MAPNKSDIINPKSKYHWWQSIRLKALLIILFMVVPLVLLGAFSILYYQDVVRQKVNDDTLSTAMTISAFTPSYMESSQLYLSSVADRSSVAGAITDNNKSVLHSTAVFTNATNRINSVYFADGNGVVIESTPELSNQVGTNSSIHPYVSSVLRTGEPCIGDAEPGFNDFPVVPMAMPVKDNNGTVIGVLVGSMDMNEFAKTISNALVIDLQQVYLVNRTGYVMVHSNPAYMEGMRDFSSVPAVQRVLHGETGVEEYYNPVYNQSVLGAYVPVESLGWGVVVSYPTDVAYRPVWNTTWPMIALFTVFTLLALGLGLFFGNYIVAPITHLTQATRKAFTNGDYKMLLPFSRKDEIGELGRSFDEMVETVKRETTEKEQAIGELRESKERFNALADNIPNLAWMANAGGWIFWYNKQWYDYTGTTLEEMQGWGWQKVHHPDYNKAVTEEWTSSIKSGKPFDNVFPLRGKDGNYSWFLTRVRPIRDEQGRIQLWFGTNTDITKLIEAEKELKDAKEQAELYTDIMGHDINNLNQVTLGYLEMIKDDNNLTGEQRAMISDALNALRSSTSIIDNVRKIQAITEQKGKVHAEDIDDMIIECIRETSKPEGKKVTINYSPRKGLTIRGTALMKEVFCNLINNAVKHSPGNVVIDVRVDEATRDSRKFYDVSVVDNGPGVPDDLKPKLFNRFQRGTTKAHGKGLGLFIVRSMVEQAGGDVKIEDRVSGDYSKGAKFIVSLPACEGECQ